MQTAKSFEPSLQNASVFFRSVLKRFLFSPILFFLIAQFLFLPVTVSADSMEEDSLPADILLVRAAQQIVNDYGNTVWPGFGDRVTPILLSSGEYDYLFNHPDPPEGFSKVEGQNSLYRKKGHLLSRPAATAYPVAGVFSVIIPAREELIAWVRDKMELPNFKVTQTEYIRAIIHESFHVYQINSLGGREAVPDFGFSGSSRDLQSRMLDSSQWKERATATGKLLSAAIKQTKLSLVRKSLKGAMQEDTTNTGNFSTEILSFERYVQWLEGTARYVDTRLIMEASKQGQSKKNNIEFQPTSEIKSDLITQLTAKLSGPTPVRDRLAAFGAAKGLLLDRLYPGWKKGFFKKRKPLAEILSTAISVPEPLKKFPVTELGFAGKSLTVALADNSARWTHGLQHVNNLKQLDGMLFVFPEEIRTGFWMKDTEMSLQIGFFNSFGYLQDSVIMEPCHTSDCPTYAPDEPFKYVLELPENSEIQFKSMEKEDVKISVSSAVHGSERNFSTG